MGSTIAGAPPRGAFLRDGYAVLKRFLDAAEVSALRADVERLLLAPQGPSCERPHNTLVPLRG